MATHGAKFVVCDPNNYFVIGRGIRYFDQCVCMSVCLSAYLKNYISKFHETFSENVIVLL